MSAGREAGPRWGALTLTLALALSGGALGEVLGIPAGWLLGSLLATMLAALRGLPLWFPRQLQTVVVLLIGVSIGGALNAAMLPDMLGWIPSLLGMFLALGLTLVVSSWFLRRVGGFNADAAVCAAYPGHIVLALQMAAERNCDIGAVTATQSLRLVFLVLCLPAIALVPGLESPLREPVVADPWAFALLTLVAAVLAWILRWLALPAAVLLGSILGSGSAAVAGVSMGAVPEVVEGVVLVLAGAMIGSRFVNTRARTLLAVLPVSLAAVALTMLVVALLAWPLSLWLGLPFLELLLAYAPGGAEVMTLIAITTGNDPALVGLHHLVRLLSMGLFLPFLVRFLAPEAPSDR